MPHLNTVGVWPHIPPDTKSDGPEGLSQIERAVRDGNYKSPDEGLAITSDQLTPGDPIPAVYSPERPVAKPSRSLFNPAGHVTLRALWPFGKPYEDDGSHDEQTKDVDMPTGQQHPLSTVASRNTWRARPQPWDAGLVVNVTPEQG